MKFLESPRNVASKIYYSSPAYVRNIFWNVYFLYIKSRGIIKSCSLKYGYKLTYVNPDRIKYALPNAQLGEKFGNIGAVEDGDWDLKGRVPFDSNKSFIALKEHFTNGTPLSKIKIYYNTILNSIEKGEVLWGCKTKDELDDRCKKIDELYYNIKAEGYKTQKELGNSVYLDEITVNVGRNGELLFEDGQHRLAIAKILGLKSISVIITKRHYQWVKFKNEVISYAERNSGKVYQPLEHPDLKDIPYLHGDERWNLILKNLPFHNGSLLDIGAQWGYFCHKFEELGFNCYAVENNPTELYFLKKLKKTDNKKFKIISKSIFDIERKKYDVVLALNIFHHFLKTKREYDRLTKFLNEIDTKIMFFEPHLFNEKQMDNAHINYSDIDFINYILENSCLNGYEYLGEEMGGRKIYILKI